jgi:hypothetical protein
MEPDAQIAFTKQKSTSAPGVGDANARLTKQIVPWLTRANTQQNRHSIQTSGASSGPGQVRQRNQCQYIHSRMRRELAPLHALLPSAEGFS